MPPRGDMCDDVRASWQWQGFLAVVRFFFLKFVGDTAVFQYFSIISTLLAASDTPRGDMTHRPNLEGGIEPTSITKRCTSYDI